MKVLLKPKKHRPRVKVSLQPLLQAPLPVGLVEGYPIPVVAAAQIQTKVTVTPLPVTSFNQLVFEQRLRFFQTAPNRFFINGREIEFQPTKFPFRFSERYYQTLQTALTQIEQTDDQLVNLQNQTMNEEIRQQTAQRLENYREIKKLLMK